MAEGRWPVCSTSRASPPWSPAGAGDRADDRPGFRRSRARRSTSRRRKAEVCDEVAAELSKTRHLREHPRRPVARRRVRSPGRGDHRAASRAEHPRQQRGRHVGCAARRLPRRRVGQGDDAEREVAVPVDPCARSGARSRRNRRRSRTRHQHRFDRRHPGPDPRDLRVLHEQGRDPSADPPSRPPARARATSPSTRSRPGRSSRR